MAKPNNPLNNQSLRNLEKAHQSKLMSTNPNRSSFYARTPQYNNNTKMENVKIQNFQMPQHFDMKVKKQFFDRRNKLAKTNFI